MSMWNGRIAAALCDLGIETRQQADAVGFLDQVAIQGGSILYQPGAPPSNILHEAGHLACIPTNFRHLASGDLEDVMQAMGVALEERMAQTGNPDDPLIRAIIQCSDPEATAWAWAFGRHLGMSGDLIILDGEYDGDGDVVRLQVSLGQHMGVNGLRAAGMLDTTRNYPRLTKWLQDAA